jgi:hypothetical protein
MSFHAVKTIPAQMKAAFACEASLDIPLFSLAMIRLIRSAKSMPLTLFMTNCG